MAEAPKETPGVILAIPEAPAPDVEQSAAASENMARIKELFAKAGVNGDNLNSVDDITHAIQDKETRDKLNQLSEQDKNELFGLFFAQADLVEEELQKKKRNLPADNPAHKLQEQVDDLAGRIAKRDSAAFAEVDRNHDGVVSADELHQSGLTMSQALGLNKDENLKDWVKENSAQVDGVRIVFGKASHDEIVGLAGELDKIKDKDSPQAKQEITEDIAKMFDKNHDGKLDETEAKIIKAAVSSNEQFAAALKAKGITDPEALIGDIRKTLAAHSVTATPEATSKTVATTAPQKTEAGLGTEGHSH